MIKKLLLATAVAIVAPAAAHAATPIYYAPNSEAFANTFGPYVAHGQTSQVSVYIKNGVVDQGSTYDSTGGSQQSWSHSPDGFTNSANVAGNTGNASSATASLQNGTIKAAVSNDNGPILRSFANGIISDTLYFNNTSGGTVYLPYLFAYDGTISGANSAGSRATSTLYTYGYGGCNANFEACAGGLQLTGGASVSAGLNITFWGGGPDSITNWGDPNIPSSYTVTNNSSGDYRFASMGAVLEIPVGYTMFSFRLAQDLDCSGAFTVCDFGHTSQFGFPSLPGGLSYSSASGVFQINDGSIPSGVPEPTTWAMMIVGLLGVGGALRRRRGGLLQQAT